MTLHETWLASKAERLKLWTERRIRRCYLPISAFTDVSHEFIRDQIPSQVHVFRYENPMVCCAIQVLVGHRSFRPVDHFLCFPEITMEELEALEP